MVLELDFEPSERQMVWRGYYLIRISDILDVDINFGCGDLSKIDSDKGEGVRDYGEMWWYMGKRGRGLRKMPRTDLK